MSTSEVKAVPKYDRPNGMTIEPYKKALKWSNKHWAWEFLRRNEAFQKATLAAKDGSPEEQQSVARRFRLRKFKGYWEEYNHPVNGKPRFIKFVPPRVDIIVAEQNAVEVQLVPGQLAIVVNVGDLASHKAVRAVLKQVTPALSKNATGSVRVRASDLIEMLRILDALQTKQDPVAMANAIYPQVVGKSAEDRRVFMRDKNSRALSYANERYLDLAHREDRVPVVVSKAIEHVIEPRTSPPK
jgi:hypothetical protein